MRAAVDFVFHKTISIKTISGFEIELPIFDTVEKDIKRSSTITNTP